MSRPHQAAITARTKKAAEIGIRSCRIDRSFMAFCQVYSNGMVLFMGNIFFFVFVFFFFVVVVVFSYFLLSKLSQICGFYKTRHKFGIFRKTRRICWICINTSQIWDFDHLTTFFAFVFLFRMRKKLVSDDLSLCFYKTWWKHCLETELQVSSAESDFVWAPSAETELQVRNFSSKCGNPPPSVRIDTHSFVFLFVSFFFY